LAQGVLKYDFSKQWLVWRPPGGLGIGVVDLTSVAKKVECSVIAFCLMTSSVGNAGGACADEAIKHVIVCSESGKFCGWPANCGLWSWGNEILVGFAQSEYVPNDCGHSRGGRSVSLLARSVDGGRSWAVEDPENFVGDGGKVKDCAGGMDFTHPDFAMRVSGDKFFVSFDRGRNWEGPYRLPDFGLGQRLTARTDYIVNGPQNCMLFLSTIEPRVEAALQDRAFCARTTDGGGTFEFVSWMTNEPFTIRSVMPSTVRFSDSRLVSAMRRRLDVEISGPHKWRKCWIDVYESNDNGRSWRFLSQVADTGNSNGNPPSLVRLSDAGLCVTYGYRGVCNRYRYRDQPQGIRARLSADGGRTWGHEISLRDDALTWDLGYTRSLQRPDGRIVTIYYYNTKERPQQHIAATIWNPEKFKHKGGKK